MYHYSFCVLFAFVLISFATLMYFYANKTLDIYLAGRSNIYKGDSFGAKVLSLVIQDQPMDRIEDEEMND